jgi:excisionase family DNA binding protein
MNNQHPEHDDQELTVQQAAEHLGVHYMTAYRYIRTGRLPAQRVGGQWRVSASSLDTIEPSSEAGRHKTGTHVNRRPYVRQLSKCLIDGDEVASWTITQDALASAFSLEDLYIEVLSPSMRHVGDEWAASRVSVAEEHRATALMYRLIGRLGPGFIRRGRSRGRVVLGAPSGDHHGLPTALLSDPLRGRRLGVADLGAHTPARSFAETVAKYDRLIGVGIVASAPLDDHVIAETISAIRSRSATPIVLGGHAIRNARHASRLGATAYADSPKAALEWFDAQAQR